MLFIRILAITGILPVPAAFISLAKPVTGSDAAGNGMTSGFLFVGILMLAGIAMLIALFGSFIVRPLDGLTKALARLPLVLMALGTGALALGIWLEYV